jgi:hypothetical protein
VVRRLILTREHVSEGGGDDNLSDARLLRLADDIKGGLDGTLDRPSGVSLSGERSGDVHHDADALEGRSEVVGGEVIDLSELQSGNVLLGEFLVLGRADSSTWPISVP